jgi:hypothetical protein
MLHLSNAIVNVGRGPLEMKPRAQDCDGNGHRQDDRTAYQRIYRDGDGDGVFRRKKDKQYGSHRAGCMFFHPQHDHWHFEDFARYSLHRFKANGSVGRAVASSDKVSFCIIDGFRERPELPGSPRSSHYVGCDVDSISGISVGWADVYGAHVPGQELDVTGLEEGRYCLVQRADPSDKLDERREYNNRRRTGIMLRASSEDVSSNRPNC